MKLLKDDVHNLSNNSMRKAKYIENFIMTLFIQPKKDIILELIKRRICGVLISVLASSAVDHGLGFRTKDYNGIRCFSDKYVALRSKSKHWLARNQENVSKWSDMTISGLVSQNYKNIIKRVGLVQSGHHHLIEWKLFLPRHTCS